MMTQIKIELSIFGEMLDNNLFSQIAKIKPTQMWNEGDELPNRKNIKRKETCWQFSTGFIQTLYIEEILDTVLNNFQPNIDKISEYIKENELKTKIDVVVEIFNENKPGLSFDNKFLSAMEKLNGEIDIDIYHIVK